jgi:DNA-binding MarR family transcriptional regulator
MQMTYERETSLGYLTNWAGRLFVRALERRLEGDSAGRMPVFFALQGGRALTQTALAQHADVEQPTMANTLKRMERDGLVVRTPDPADGRSALVRLTELGERRTAAAFAAAVDVNQLALAALSEAERPLFVDMLRRVIATMGRDGSEPESR